MKNYKIALYIFGLYIIWLLSRFYKAYRYLAFGLSGISIPGTKSEIKDIISDWLDGSGELKLAFDIANYSNQRFRVKNYYFELYTPDGRFVAAPSNPEDIRPLDIEPRQKQTIYLTYSVDAAGIIQLLKQLDGFTPFDKAYNALKQYFATGEFGVDAVLKGSIKVAGLPLDIPVNYKTII